MRNIFRGSLSKFLFSGSRSYWIKRYESGGNSGYGSYWRLAQFKAEVINRFIAENNISTVIDLGCGDGHQLSLLKIPNYLGFDISERAIEFSRKTFESDSTKVFRHFDDYHDEKAELALSLDVLYHLIEDSVYDAYMKRLFIASDKYVIIYSSNTYSNQAIQASHIKHRKFTDWIARHKPDWRLDLYIKNKYPFSGDDKSGSFADFYIFRRHCC